MLCRSYPLLPGLAVAPLTPAIVVANGVPDVDAVVLAGSDMEVVVRQNPCAASITYNIINLAMIESACS
jgi:hypothetical protein